MPFIATSVKKRASFLLVSQKQPMCFTLNFYEPGKFGWNLLAKCLRYVISYKYTTSFPLLGIEVRRR